MSLHHGRTILAIPGPSVMPERVIRAMHRASPNIYEGEMIDMTATILPDLKKVARTSGNVAIYIGNGHSAWEASINNTLNKGDKVLVLGTGRFGPGWGDMGKSLGIDVELMDFGMHSDADPARIYERLRADKSNEIRAVLTVQTDTASSVQNDIPAIRKAINDANHPALFMVDCIASLGCEPHEMDQWGVDVMVSACQKGLMTPAGLAFVFFNEKAQKARKLVHPSLYWDWTTRANPDVYYQHFGGTAPTHHLYALREALDMIVHEEGIENVWARHETFANAIWAAIDAWGDTGTMWHNIKSHSKRSRGVSSVQTTPDVGGILRHDCEFLAGVTLGIGLGMAQPNTPEYAQYFRIGHMGHLNVHMVMGTLGAIDFSLKRNNIPHGDGALAAAAKVMADHNFN
ncbi:septum site-determining protein [Amylibacter kogurei]|uniref:Septum site-determining protein n=1 Tax=Paramylibacter kogurei TaxID=1889778 RepID=A0A2G5K1V0_9RHOB|nr:aminotransferase class V-fold PLP-dependent enzyme [Amylibacter kogurei]PIB23508.1 septum site-determining protein [Amylibacter kogurei]